MPRLTLKQIEQAIERARAAGLSASEIDGIRFALLDNAAELSGGERLAMAQQLLPDAEKSAADRFVDVFGGLTDDLIAGAGQALDALSDDEWAELTRGDNGE
jgi:hypothetical protein